MNAAPKTIQADVIIHYRSSQNVTVTTKEDSQERRFDSLKAALDYCEGLKSKRLKRIAVMNGLGNHVGSLVL